MAWGDLSTGQKITTGTLGGGAVLGSLWDMFGNKNKNPANEANSYLDQIPGTMKPYYEPYINAGNNALPGYQEMVQKLMNNPEEIIKRLGAGYKESPGFEFNKNQALTGIGNAAAAGGMAGSPQHQQQAGQLAEQLSSEDYDKYMNQVLGLLGGGVEGTGGLVKQGYGASNDLATALAQILGQKGQYAYAGQAGENQAKSQDKSNLFGGLSSLASLAMFL